jgi:hypothetical protein
LKGAFPRMDGIRRKGFLLKSTICTAISGFIEQNALSADSVLLDLANA